MEKNLNIVEYEVIKNDTVIHKGKSHTAWLNGLCDIYLDFENSPNRLKIYYKDKILEVSSPDDFTYRTVL